MPKFHSKKKIKKKNIFIITILLIILSIIGLFKYYNNKMSPLLFEYASIEVDKLINIIVNNSIKQNIEKLSLDNLFILTKDSSNEIKMVDFNSIEVNKLLTLITSDIQLSLKKIETGDIASLNIDILSNYNKNNLEKGIIYEIPSGVIHSNSLLANLGPKIPVKINLNGSVNSNIKTNIKNYGINNALIEVYIDISVNTRILLPFVSKLDKVNFSIPLSYKLIQGVVPNYYANGISKNSSSFSIPLE